MEETSIPDKRKELTKAQGYKHERYIQSYFKDYQVFCDGEYVPITMRFF